MSKVTGNVNVNVGIQPWHICSFMNTTAQQWRQAALPNIAGPGFEAHPFTSCVTFGKPLHFSELYRCLFAHSRCSIDVAAEKNQ